MDNTSGKIGIKGFKASAVASGLKKNGNLDMALICSEQDATAAGVFTTNRVKAAPVLLSKEVVARGKARAIVVNSGNANACTGAQGLANAKKTADMVAAKLGFGGDEVLVSSTGVIGAQLDMQKVEAAVSPLVETLSADGFEEVARAIMTTDSFAKLKTFDGIAGGASYRILAMAKGAGMIMPNMATMLSFVITDIDLDTEALQKALSEAAQKTFNRISVDGDTSTNDMVVALANGAAGNGPLSSEEYDAFLAGLTNLMDELATMIVKDGEGATKVVRVRVRGAASAADAERAARTIANSPLVKTAFYGEDPNWGRIMGALGRSGIQMKEEDVSIKINDVRIVDQGLGKGADAEKAAAEMMKSDRFDLIVDLHQGPFEDRMVTCDLTHEYVSINADYRT